jgi:two-component system chemotaxis sensor kinase CheA
MTAEGQVIQAEIDRLTSLSQPDFETGLAHIAEMATEAYPLAGALAREILQNLRQAGEGGTDEQLKADLGRLQEALEREASLPGPAPATELADDPELVADFVVESREHLAAIETNLLVLEKGAADPDIVNSVFRSFHTIKGLSGFLALGPIHEVSHQTETLLHQARENRIAITPGLVDLTLQAADYIRAALDALSEKAPKEAMQSLSPAEHLLKAIAAASEATELAPPSASFPQVAAERAADEAPAVKTSDASVVRVDTGKLEYLVEMVGELVIAQSLIHFGPGIESGVTAALSRNFAHLGRVTGEIQKTVLSMRMVPISRLYDKMTRLVRDLSRKSGKPIELRRIGDQVELDRNIIDEITDPLVHMIRNSVDHGIEEAKARAAAGKSETARITLEALHQAGHIIIRLSDDGRGLRADRIFEKAVERGLISPDAKLDTENIHKLIFEPGFSTAERVTDISGRGVGMDVVRRQIEKLRGNVEIASAPGAGSTFTLKLPLTLAMVDGLILESAGERYVLPIHSIREMFQVTRDKLFTIESRVEMVLLRGSLLPVVRLDRFFNNAKGGATPGDIGIVVDGRGRPFCMVVDRMLGKQEVVIKALAQCFKKVKGLAGGAILGDGRVGLILDVHGIDGGETSES